MAARVKRAKPWRRRRSPTVVGWSAFCVTDGSYLDIIGPPAFVAAVLARRGIVRIT